MEQQVSKSGLGSPILQQIREEMRVYDREGEEIGQVEKVYLGSVSEDVDAYGAGPATAYDPDLPGEGSLIDNIAEVFTADDKLPEVLRERLLRHGFIRIDSSGLFTGDRYVLPDQIATVSADRIYLNVAQDELIER